MKETLDFFKDLKRNNNREWFAANRERYLNVKARCETFALRMIAAVGRVDPQAGRLSVEQCTYRIYRDTRFSPDKSPYKTHYGIFVNPPAGKKSLTMGYYFHIEPGKCYFAAGTICLPSRLMAMLRQSIRDNLEEYTQIVHSEEFRRMYPHYGINPLKTAPKGFDRQWPYLDLVRPREFVVSTGSMLRHYDRFFTFEKEVNDPASGSALAKLAKAEAALLPYLREAKKFNDFMNYTIDGYKP